MVASSTSFIEPLGNKGRNRNFPERFAESMNSDVIVGCTTEDEIMVCRKRFPFPFRRYSLEQTSGIKRKLKNQISFLAACKVCENKDETISKFWSFCNSNHQEKHLTLKKFERLLLFGSWFSELRQNTRWSQFCIRNKSALYR